MQAYPNDTFKEWKTSEDVEDAEGEEGDVMMELPSKFCSVPPTIPVRRPSTELSVVSTKFDRGNKGFLNSAEKSARKMADADGNIANKSVLDLIEGNRKHKNWAKLLVGLFGLLLVSAIITSGTIPPVDIIEHFTSHIREQNERRMRTNGSWLNVLKNSAGIAANFFILAKQVVDIPMLYRRFKTKHVDRELSYWFFACIAFFQMQRVTFYMAWWHFRGFHLLALVSIFSLVVCAVRVGTQLKFQDGRKMWEAYFTGGMLATQLLGLALSFIFGSSYNANVILQTNGLVMSMFGTSIILATLRDVFSMWNEKELGVISLRYCTLTFFEKVSSVIYASIIADYFTFGFMVAASTALWLQISAYFIIWRKKNAQSKENIKEVEKSTIGEMLTTLAKRQREGKVIANLAVGNPTFEPPRPFLNAFQKTIVEACKEQGESNGPGMFRYTPPEGLAPLRDLIAKEVGRRQNMHHLEEVQAKHIVMTAGAQSALGNVLRSILSPKHVVVLHKPIYPYFKIFIDTWHGDCEFADCDDDFNIEVGSMKKAMDRAGAELKAILLCSPGNPSGKIISNEVMKEIVLLAQEHSKRHKSRVWLVMDNTYWNIVWNDAFVPPTFPLYDDTIIISSFSKDLGLAGERLGYLAVNPRSEAVDEMIQSVIASAGALGNICPPSIIQYAMLDFMKDDVAFRSGLDQYKLHYKVCLDSLYKILLESGFHDMKYPEGGFYLFPKLPSGISEEHFVDKLQENNIFVMPGSLFKMPGYIRFCALLAPNSEGLNMVRDVVKPTVIALGGSKEEDSLLGGSDEELAWVTPSLLIPVPGSEFAS